MDRTYPELDRNWTEIGTAWFCEDVWSETAVFEKWTALTRNWTGIGPKLGQPLGHPFFDTK
jgi:hypothetical protein